MERQWGNWDFTCNYMRNLWEYIMQLANDGGFPEKGFLVVQR